jgi:hypothetical protein
MSETPNPPTAAEAIAEIRDIAWRLSIPRVHHGSVMPSLCYKVGRFLFDAGVPMSPWRSQGIASECPPAIEPNEDRFVFNAIAYRRYMNDAAIFGTTEDKTIAEIARFISTVYLWQKRREMELPSELNHWTPERAEQAIREAASALPRLCDQLEFIETDGNETAKCDTL